MKCIIAPGQHGGPRIIDLSRVDLNLLAVFDALMETRQVTRAAEKVRLSQPAVSHALRRLRLLFEDDLFVRGPGGMQPTRRAIDLHVPVHAALDLVRAALNARASFDPATARRKFRFAMTEIMTVEVLPRVLRLLRQRALGVDLTVIAAEAGEIASIVARDEADIGAGVLWNLPKGISSEVLFTDTLACVVDRSHPRLRQGRLGLDDYLAASHVTVAGQRHVGIELDEILARLGIHRRIVATLPHYLAIPGAVRGTDLVGHIARKFAPKRRGREGWAVFPPPIAVPIPALRFLQVWHQRNESDAGQRWMRSLITEAVKDWPE